MAGKLFLEKAYLAYFGRPVDPTGATAFASSTDAQVEAAFFASPESKALFGQTFGPDQINQIYLTLFGRPAEQAGLDYWTNQVQLGLLTPAGAALGIQAGARNADITALENKLAASASFTASLDTPAEIQGYSGDPSAATARDFLKTITAAPATAAQVNLAVEHTVAAFYVKVAPIADGLSLVSEGTSVNRLALTAQTATSLTISGHAVLDLNDSTLPAVTAIEATGYSAGLSVNLSGNAGASTIKVGNGQNVVYTGSLNDKVTVGNGFNIVVTGAGDDQIIGGNGSASRFFSAGVDARGNVVRAEDEIIHYGNRILAGAGKDTITLGKGAVDLLRYADVTDSNGANTDVVNGFETSFVAGQIARSTTVNGVVTTTMVDVIGRDVINLALIQFGPGARSYAGEVSGMNAVLSSLTAGSVKAVLDTSSSTVYIDVDGSGTLDGKDMSIQLVGVTSLTAGNFEFGTATST